jgi:hypothetical protein
MVVLYMAPSLENAYASGQRYGESMILPESIPARLPAQAQLPLYSPGPGRHQLC